MWFSGVTFVVIYFSSNRRQIRPGLGEAAGVEGDGSWLGWGWSEAPELEGDPPGEA